MSNQLPKLFVTDDDSTGVLLGAPEPDFPTRLDDMPLSPVRLVPAILITASELEYVRDGGRAAREDLVGRLQAAAVLRDKQSVVRASFATVCLKPPSFDGSRHERTANLCPGTFNNERVPFYPNGMSSTRCNNGFPNGGVAYWRLCSRGPPLHSLKRIEWPAVETYSCVGYMFMNCVDEAFKEA